MRILYDNAADRAVITASSTAGNLVAANLQTDRKFEFHRSVGPSVTYSLVWPGGEVIAAVAVPASSLSSAATIRVRLYADAGRTTLLADSGVQYACPGHDLGKWDWSQPINANAFINGGYARAAVWFGDVYFARVCDVDIADPENAAGYIDTARLMAGDWWSPEYGAGMGTEIESVDQSTLFRNDAGDLLSDTGSQHERLSLPIPYLGELDRAQFMQIVRFVGTSKTFLISPHAGQGMTLKEQDHMVFGKRANDAVRTDFYDGNSTKLQIEGW